MHTSQRWVSRDWKLCSHQLPKSLCIWPSPIFRSAILERYEEKLLRPSTAWISRVWWTISFRKISTVGRRPSNYRIDLCESSVKLRAMKPVNPVLKDFLKVFLVPTLINKMFMMYFGLNYSEYPGEGYGYGLCATILFLLFTVGRFIWRYKDIEDP